MKATVYWFFGEMGSGKSYTGIQFAEQKDLPFLEGDDLLTERMRARVRRFGIPNQNMLDEYFLKLINAVDTMVDATANNIVVAQACYRRIHRQWISEQLFKKGIFVVWCPVEVGFWRNLIQLWSRQYGLLWILYWLVNKPFFQTEKNIFTQEKK